MRAVNLTGSNQQIPQTVTVRYAGFSVRETSGTARALIVIWDTDTSTATGTILEQIALSPGETAREYYPSGDPFVAFKGIYVQVVSGAVAGSVRIG
jgi:hypothetical protein